MKKKEKQESISVIFGTSLKIVLLEFIMNFGLACIIDLFLMQIIIPLVGVVVPPMVLANYIKSLDSQSNTFLSRIFFEICMFISLFISMVLTYNLSKARKKSFISDTKGLITRKNSFRYHLEHHRFSELAIFICIFIVSVLLPKLSPFAIFYRLGGLMLSIPVALICIPLAQIWGIIASQEHWRAEYFIGE